jgi:hypothetical protein
MNQFAIVPCPKCGNQVHIAPAAGMGYCPKCMSQVPMPAGGAPMAAYGAPGAMPGQLGMGAPYGAPAGGMPGQPGAGAYGAPPGAMPGMGAPAGMPGQPGMPGAYGAPLGGQPGMPGAYGAPPGGQLGMPGAAGAPPGGQLGMPGAAGGFPMGGFPGMAGARKPPSMFAIFGGVALTVIGGIAYGVFRAYVGFAAKPGHASTSSLGIDEKAADVDKMIAAVRSLAKKWRPDAEFYSVNVLGLGPSGTVNLTDSGSVVTIEYFSPSAVSSPSSSVRSDSIKKFNFNSVGLDYSVIWGVKERQEHVPPTPIPSCTAKQVAAALAAKGLKAGKTAHISVDPTFSFATKELSWHAMADEPKIDAWLSIASCAPTK